jgi:co-chaperonin GroES (HSP10)
MSKQKFKLNPLPDKIIVQQHSKVNPSTLIAVAEQHQELQDRGTIVAIGKQDKHLHSLKVGDTVIFGSYSGNKIKFMNETYLVMQLPDIIGTIND